MLISVHHRRQASLKDALSGEADKTEEAWRHAGCLHAEDDRVGGAEMTELIS